MWFRIEVEIGFFVFVFLNLVFTYGVNWVCGINFVLFVVYDVFYIFFITGRVVGFKIVFLCRDLFLVNVV